MQINDEIFDIVNFTASGLLVTVAGTLGMNFTSSQFAEIVLTNNIDDREELLLGLQQLLDTNLLLLQNNIYYVNSDYVKPDDF